MPSRIMTIHEKDNVAIALQALKKGDALTLPGGDSLSVQTDIPFGHKLALMDIADGSAILKYGEAIGRAKGLIRRGEWVHTHNLASYQ